MHNIFLVYISLILHGGLDKSRKHSKHIFDNIFFNFWIHLNNTGKCIEKETCWFQYKMIVVKWLLIFYILVISWLDITSCDAAAVGFWLLLEYLMNFIPTSTTETRTQFYSHFFCPVLYEIVLLKGWPECLENLREVLNIYTLRLTLHCVFLYKIKEKVIFRIQ